MADLKNRKIEMFRCHIDPAVPPKPRNAFHRKEFSKETDFELTPVGVYVRYVATTPGSKTFVSEHLIPFANIQSIKMMPLEDDKAT